MPKNNNTKEAKESISSYLMLSNRLVRAGMLWPSALGRSLLQEIDQLTPIETNSNNSEYVRIYPDLVLMHKFEDSFLTKESAKKVLFSYIAEFKKYQQYFSKQHCFAVVEESDNNYKLWQILKTDNNLMQQLKKDIEATSDADEVAKIILQSASFMYQAQSIVSMLYASNKLDPTQITIYQDRPVLLQFIQQKLSVDSKRKVSKPALIHLFFVRFRMYLSKILSLNPLLVDKVLESMRTVYVGETASKEITKIMIAVLEDVNKNLVTS